MTEAQKKILSFLGENGSASATELGHMLKVSRQYVHTQMHDLRESGRVVLLGRANRARYVLARKDLVAKVKSSLRDIHRIFANKNLQEDVVFDDIKQETGIFEDMPENVERMAKYAFTEMLNNAIDHSQTEVIDISVKRDNSLFRFMIIDHGIGIFNNLMQKRGLASELEAVQDLLKGKQTTAPGAHTGEGIFFTSKVADTFTISSGKKRIIFANMLDDVFVEDNMKNRKGTKISFVLSIRSKKDLKNIFDEYSSDSYEFNKTSVAVRLYKMGSMYISRSQGRRIMTGLDKFAEVVLDFRHISTVGQAFADEVFRVWARNNPRTKVTFEHANENVSFMIQHVLGSLPEEKTLFS